MTRCLWIVPATFALLVAASPLCGQQAEPPLQERMQLRRPTALEFTLAGDRLLVANRSSGTLTLLDTNKQTVIGETAVGKQLSDVRRCRPGLFLVTDEQAHQLLLVELQNDRLGVRQRLDVPPYPVSISVTADGRRAFVASLWSRQLSQIGLPEGEPARVDKIIDLPYAPRVQRLVREDTRLIVADAFGGQLGIVDAAECMYLGARKFPAHNIRGLAVSRDGKMLLVAHQMLNELAHTVRNDVHWGLLMSNDLRWLQLESVLDLEANLYQGAHMHPLGEASSATGDPSGLDVAPDGTAVVALGGVNEVAIGKEQVFRLLRAHVGKRPTAVRVGPKGKLAYVLNTFDDSLSIVHLEQRETIATIVLGPQRELTLAERGELLFYDARLSHDSWMSCHSCHTDGHTNGHLNDNFSDKSFGAPKRVLSLLGRAGTEPFAWNGGAADLKEQITKSIEVTMQGDQPATSRQLAALSAYVRSLPLPPSIDAVRKRADPAAIERGRALFTSQGCVQCHAPPHYTTPETYDVGLTDKLGNREFNPPPLGGVGQRGPYFHDNRAATLDEILKKFRHKLKQPLRDNEADDLAAFLRSL